MRSTSGLLPVMHRSDVYSSTSYSRGIRWLPSPEVCRMASTFRYMPVNRQALYYCIRTRMKTCMSENNDDEMLRYFI